MHFLILAKIQLLGSSKFHKYDTKPILATLIWPFFLKAILSLRPIKDIVRIVVHDSRLFVFQLAQIISLDEYNEEARRWGRVRRLVHDRFVGAGRSIAFVANEQSLHTVSMVAL
ncbi:hypothetical protein CTI12_AA621010 [Artemisia annua]|uniref:Uncharacterized protein n=1 Tax=Artemisia annua TaxID=35608 RepID=A0A2U1KBU6_ARTAN|nr:hypothetical protein CTI12_AA621010 [Artemisia annua]